MQGSRAWVLEARRRGPRGFLRLRVRLKALRMLWRLVRRKTGKASQELDTFSHQIAVLSGLPQVTPSLLDDMVRDNRKPLLLDARSPAEHAVSCISGARLVDPSVALPIVISAIEAGRPIVIYCAVGVRSTDLALSIEATLPEHRAIEIYNLEGGIFRWQREGRLLVDARGPTDRLHPFSRHWARLLGNGRQR